MARGRLEYLHTYARSTHDVEIPDRFVGFQLVPGSAELLDEARTSMPKLLTERKYGILAQRLESGLEQVFFARNAGGAIVGWAHLIRGQGPNTRINHTLRLRRTDAYLYDDAVDLRHRRKGIHSFMVLRRLQLAEQDGCVRAVTEIADRNRPSIRSYKRLGFAARSKIVYLRPVHHAVELPLRPAWLRKSRSGR